MLVFLALELYPQLEAKANALTSLALIPNVCLLYTSPSPRD